MVPASRRRPRLKAAGQATSALDYPMLVALLNAARMDASPYVPDGEDGDGAAGKHDNSFIDLIEGGPAWRHAILGQGGSFNRDIAERDIAPPREGNVYLPPVKAGAKAENKEGDGPETAPVE